MTTLSKLSLLAGVLILSLSCGPAKTVQYVHVDNPVYAPAPSANQGITVDNSSVVPPANNQKPSGFSNTTSSGQNFSKTADHERCMILADEYVPGVFRGYGYSKKMNLNAARGTARAIATAEALTKMMDVITDASNVNNMEDNESSQETYWRSITSKAKTYKITNPIIVCSSTSQSNGYFIVSMCVQTSAEDLLDFLEEEINKLPKAEREEFQNTVINYNALKK